jgi:hypothetical protein
LTTNFEISNLVSWFYAKAFFLSYMKKEKEKKKGHIIVPSQVWQ